MEIRSYDLNIDPVVLLQALRGYRGCFLLESSMRQLNRGRYSYLGFDPFLTVKGNDLKAFAKLEKSYQRFYRPLKNSLTPFSAGIAGYLSYDFGLEFEAVKSRRKTPDSPGFVFGFYDCVITIDHFKKKVLVSSNGLPQADRVLRKKRAIARLERIENILQNLPPQKALKSFGSFSRVNLKSNFNKTGYCNAVKKALDYIKRGDIYQVNLAQEFSCKFNRSVDAIKIYETLRRLSPSCFSGYFDCGAFEIVSSSPEMFLRLQGDLVQTRPMKGTRSRGITRAQDHRRNLELRQNAKEKAELLMVTDLERNDLGRVCDFGSIKVKTIRKIEKYRTVYQATSTVIGTLAKNKNGFDLLKNCFPSGSVTGCPKIRAMQIIEELEPSARGIYTGALGYMDFAGDLAFNVLIRTLLVKAKGVSFHVGSGIVADSAPLLEYEETLVKAQALKESLALCNLNY